MMLTMAVDDVCPALCNRVGVSGRWWESERRRKRGYTDAHSDAHARGSRDAPRGRQRVAGRRAGRADWPMDATWECVVLAVPRAGAPSFQRCAADEHHGDLGQYTHTHAHTQAHTSPTHDALHSAKGSEKNAKGTLSASAGTLARRQAQINTPSSFRSRRSPARSIPDRRLASKERLALTSFVVYSPLHHHPNFPPSVTPSSISLYPLFPPLSLHHSRCNTQSLQNGRPPQSFLSTAITISTHCNEISRPPAITDPTRRLAARNLIPPHTLTSPSSQAQRLLPSNSPTHTQALRPHPQNNTQLACTETDCQAVILVECTECLEFQCARSLTARPLANTATSRTSETRSCEPWASRPTSMDPNSPSCGWLPLGRQRHMPARLSKAGLRIGSKTVVSSRRAKGWC